MRSIIHLFAGFRLRLGYYARLRGYYSLRRKGGLQQICRLHQALREKNLEIERRKISALIFQRGEESAELIVRQKLSKLQFVINKILLISLGSGIASNFILPIPKVWHREVELHFGRCIGSASNIFFYTYVVFEFLAGLATAFRFILAAFPLPLSYKSFSRGDCHFVGLTSGCIGSNKAVPQANIVSWYFSNIGRQGNFIHSVSTVEPYEYQPGRLVTFRPLVPNRGYQFRGYVGFVFWAIRATLIAALSLIIGRWWNALMLKESVLCYIFSTVPRNCLPDSYYFHNGYYYPPLWSYGVEARGVKIVCYFYSTNSEPMTLPPTNRKLRNAYWLMNWRNYLVWDGFQENFINSFLPLIRNIKKVGPIPFSDCDKALPKWDEPTLVIFDVTPRRLIEMSSYGVESELYAPRYVIKFLEDTVSVGSELGLKILIKAKRDFNSHTSSSYVRYLRSLGMKDGVTFIEPCVSAFRTVESSNFIVSFPFTSTALIGKHFGIPSFYYDPSGILDHQDPAAHGIRVFASTEELKAEFLKLMPRSVQM